MNIAGETTMSHKTATHGLTSTAHNAALAILTMLLLVHLPAVGDDSSAEFQRAYRAYQKHIAANETQQALESASKAYTLGARLYGKKSVNAAKLAINYAVLLNDSGEFEQAQKVLKGKLKVMEAEYGANATELVSILIELGRSEFDPAKPKRALKYFSQASSALENHDNSLYRARKNFDIAVILLKRRGRAFTQEYIETAHSIYARELQTNDFRLGLTSYHMAAYAIAEQQYEQAVAHLMVSLDAFQSDDDEMSDLETTVRLQLIEFLERLDKSDLATEHCVALGSKYEWTTSAPPLYRETLVTPPEAVKAGLVGEVTLAFAVDEQGYVADPRISTSTAAIFNQPALDMVRQFRYAPRFVDGRPVLTDDVHYTIRFGPAPPQQAKQERIPGWDGFGRPPTRWRLEQQGRPDFDPGMVSGGGKN
jgi:TonB family protein